MIRNANTRNNTRPAISRTFYEQHGVLTTVENVTYAEVAEKSANASPQSVSRKILARRKAAKERNSKVGVPVCCCGDVGGAGCNFRRFRYGPRGRAS